jgi:hypothetical protein
MKKAINLEKVIKLSNSTWLKCYNEKRFPDKYNEAKTALDEALKPIDESIKAVEGRASARTITAREMLDAVKRLEDKLSIPKKYMVGTKAVIDVNAQDFPSAYKYTPMSTIFEMERRPTGWFVTGIRRSSCHKDRYQVTLSDEAKKAILENYARF